MAKWRGEAWETILRMGPTCEYCGLGDNGDPRIWPNFDLDHLIPRGHGHDHVPMNHIVACVGCNSAKGDFDPSGHGSIPLTADTRSLLVNRARTYIQAANRSNCAGENYGPLLDAIRRAFYPHIAVSATDDLRAAVAVGLVPSGMLT
jgi:hypothetical protein